MIRESISKNGVMIRVRYRQGNLKEKIVHELKPVFIGVMHKKDHSMEDSFIEPPQLIEHALVPSPQDSSPLNPIGQSTPICKGKDKFEWKLENV